ncbi:hypothetical protein OK016_17850 [Vibrio chagasii]|nr:hypothetical protein [Vibrio chagasii]
MAGNIDKPKRFRGVKASMFSKHVKVLNIGNDDTVTVLLPLALRVKKMD